MGMDSRAGSSLRLGNVDKGIAFRGMRLRFTRPRVQQRGLIASMLKRSYADLVELDQQHWGPEVPKWEEFDREVFEHPDTVGTCVFLT